MTKVNNITARFPIGVVDANGHLYTKECMEKALADVQLQIAARRFLVHAESERQGGGEMPGISSTVGIVTGAKMKDSEVVLEIEPLPGSGVAR